MEGNIFDPTPRTQFSLTLGPPRARPRKKHEGKRENCGRRKQRESPAARFYENCVESADPQELSFRHSGWWSTREKIRRHLANCGANRYTLDRWDNCGSSCFAEWSPSKQRHRLRANYCHSRHCMPCSRAKATRLALNLRSRLADRPRGRYRFVTLTTKNVHQDLAKAIARIYRCFKQLRTTPVWRNQAGGCFILEVKWSQDAGWHPHLHVITEGGWISQSELADQWYQVTGDSFVVDVRALTTGYDPADYLAKYVTKGTTSDVWNDDDAATEWITASKGVRCAATFGDWRGFALCKQPDQVKDWQPVGRLVKIIAAARAHEPWAVAIIKSLRATALVEADRLYLDHSPPPSQDEIPPWISTLPPPLPPTAR